MFKKIWRAIAPNPLDQLLKKTEGKRILLFWNRGLGDIALGLYAIVLRIRHYIPDAQITFLTRPNLADGFALLSGVDLIVAPALKRGEPINVRALLKQLGHNPEDFDLIIESPDPTYWVRWQLGKVTPRLVWQPKWDALCEKYGLNSAKEYVGVHVQTETNYAHWRNWPNAHWQELFERLNQRGQKVILFGFAKDPHFDLPNVIDLRGETPLFELLSIIKNRCHTLVVPDSGISSMTYFLDLSFPLKIVSLWGNPDMGILKQNVASPNPELVHIPLIADPIADIVPSRVENHI